MAHYPLRPCRTVLAGHRQLVYVRIDLRPEAKEVQHFSTPYYIYQFYANLRIDLRPEAKEVQHFSTPHYIYIISTNSTLSSQLETHMPSI